MTSMSSCIPINIMISSDFFPGIFFREWAKSIVMQIFLLLSDQILEGAKVSKGGGKLL